MTRKLKDLQSLCGAGNYGGVGTLAPLFNPSRLVRMGKPSLRLAHRLAHHLEGAHKADDNTFVAVFGDHKSPEAISTKRGCGGLGAIAGAKPFTRSKEAERPRPGAGPHPSAAANRPRTP